MLHVSFSYSTWTRQAALRVGLRFFCFLFFLREMAGNSAKARFRLYMYLAFVCILLSAHSYHVLIVVLAVI